MVTEIWDFFGTRVVSSGVCCGAREYVGVGVEQTQGARRRQRVRMPAAAFTLLYIDAVLPVQRTVHTDKKSEHSCSRHKGRDPTYLLTLPRPVLEDNGRWIRRWRRVGDAFHLTRQRKLLPPRCDQQCGLCSKIWCHNTNEAMSDCLGFELFSNAAVNHARRCM